MKLSLDMFTNLYMSNFEICISGGYKLIFVLELIHVFHILDYFIVEVGTMKTSVDDSIVTQLANGCFHR